MALFNTLDLTHWAAWGDLLLIWKHKYYLPTGVNLVFFCHSTGAIGKFAFNRVKQGGVDIAWTLKFCFRGVTHEWISSIFEVSFLFWIAVLSPFSSWYDMIVHVKLVVYDAWTAEEYETGFLSVGEDIFDRLYLKELPISLPMVTMSTIKQIYDKWDYVRKLNKIEICEIFDD